MEYEDQSDTEVRIRGYCDAGDHRAAATLAIEAYGPELVQFIAIFLRDTDAASEVFSQTCENVWRGVPAMHWKSSLRAWSYAVARNACRDHLRSPARRRLVPLTGSDEAAQLAESVRVRTLPYLRTDVKARFAQLREALSPDEQTLLTLRVDRHLSWNEIAEILTDDPVDDAGVDLRRASAAMCRKRFERLMDKLRELAKATGLIDAADDES
jgi:RNA polymerase sigma-70 factor (ECF subfamily)